MFRQVCLLALLAVNYGQNCGYRERVKGLIPPYPLTKLFGDPDCTLCYPIDETTTISENNCKLKLNLFSFGCLNPLFVNITVYDWQPVKDIVVAVPGAYRHLKVYRKRPCSGDAFVEIHAACAWLNSDGRQ